MWIFDLNTAVLLETFQQLQYITSLKLNLQQHIIFIIYDICMEFRLISSAISLNIDQHFSLTFPTYIYGMISIFELINENINRAKIL